MYTIHMRDRGFAGQWWGQILERFFFQERRGSLCNSSPRTLWLLDSDPMVIHTLRRLNTPHSGGTVPQASEAIE